ncbi:hypothetical protein BATDEDRAFT_88748 [Batrachochytrium dendrobatidis JAM81]|uniref:Uncharacterized protein n=3 Tax=Batrachochytrium dendrobatidis TaxID=109871 RepID=F4P2P2_BATDJ|nr:uncharacterized protein BATDEDRAFT_88748 [Batrachochytrium dendrobatidis JAM81]EGF80495.1 hypothetical protein BATDEDRAFT_88748 [Batrachochytrium dendrobatidis JAM81]KAK5670107.1 Activating signal cointegrator 1 [Batrachochytrium dendrobatidis]OAJ40958.1 hypothetical protein BDEG_24629 [Batrachochytrium dendrobatidis JEL423]|eukprot:XP_006679301.1 hypothetical protein BATDEDRAFT_88748 [Batrachochytrium dendrobatidis JAM81]
MSTKLEDWATNEVIRLLGHSLPRNEVHQLITYSLTLDTKDEAANYFQDLLGTTEESLEFISEFLTKRFPPLQTVGAWSSTATASRKEKQASIQREQELLEDERLKQMQLEQSQQRFGLDGEVLYSKSTQDPSVSNSNNQKPHLSGGVSKRQQRKQIKDREAMEQVGNQPAGFGGRPVCECMAALHGLVSNCLNCGKIVCVFEGEGPCSTCGNQVQASNRHFALNLDTQSTIDFDKAQARKNKLLDFDRHSTSRTKVHDAASDFDLSSDTTNKWLTPEERGLALRKQQEIERIKAEQKTRRVMTIDVENRRVVLETEPDAKQAATKSIMDKDVGGGVPFSFKNQNLPTSKDHTKSTSTGVFFNPNLKTPAPKFVAKKKPNPVDQSHKQKSLTPTQRELLRLQDDYRVDIDPEGSLSSIENTTDFDEPICAAPATMQA